MYIYLQTLHSYWAYFTLFILVVAVINAVAGLTTNKEYTMAKDLRIGLFALIFSHIQLLLGVILYFFRLDQWGEGGVMASSDLRLILLEHPLMNIIAIALITIGWSKHKKETSSKGKFKKIAIFYGLGLIFILSRIPYNAWFN